MSMVNIRSVELLSNPAKFDDEYHFRIKFEAIAPLAEGKSSLYSFSLGSPLLDLEWRLIYVGSAKSEEYDQELDSCLVGPIPAGINAFDFMAPAPQHHLLPSLSHEDILGVTVIIITASYRDKEFVRVGYYVNTYYEDDSMMQEPPSEVQWDRLQREVLVSKPKVTRFQNPWDSAPSASAFDAPIQQEAGGSGSSYMLDSAPLPPPVTKAAPPPGQQTGGYDTNGMQQSSGFGMQEGNGYNSMGPNGHGHGQNGHGGMDVDQAMVA